MAKALRQVAERYELLRQLGVGSQGVVYAAFDLERQLEVAIKTISGIADADTWRLKHEFRTLIDVRHPNLVEYYELFADQNELHLVMELVPGHPLMQDRPRGVPPTTGAQFDQIRAHFSQLAHALTYLHEMEIIHRDIKPSNVLVTPEGRIVLLDFGLAKRVVDEATWSWAGTPAYMAPEVLAGSTSSIAADWYSVGVMLYEALVGSGPAGREHRSHLAVPPPRPSVHNQNVPLDLDDLCHDLVQARPNLRPHAYAILRRLGMNLTPRKAGHRAETTTLEGRERELQRLHKLLDLPHTVVAHVRGASGIGKTALCERVIEDAINRDHAVVFHGRCYRQESIPFKALDPILDSLCRYIDRLPLDRAIGLLPADIFELARVFPSFRNSNAVRHSRRRIRVSDDVNESRHRAIEALRHLFCRISSETTVVLWIDDSQWGDADSAQVLSSILGGATPPRLAILLSYRSDDGQASPFLRGLESVAVERVDVDLGPLGYESCKALARRLLAERGLQDHATIARAVEESSGNPFFVEQLTRFLAEDLQSSVDNQPLHSDEAPGWFRAMINTTVARLSEDERQVLYTVSSAGHPIEPRVAEQAAGIRPNGVTARKLCEFRMLRITRTPENEMLTPFHDQIAAVLETGVSPEQSKAIHARLASTLQAVNKDRKDLIATHLREAGMLEQAAEAAFEAGERAFHTLAFEQACTWFVRSRTWNTDLQHQRRCSSRLAEALESRGRFSEAAFEYTSLMLGACESERIQLCRQAALQWLSLGNLERGLPLMLKAMREAGCRPSRSGVAAKLELFVLTRRIARRLPAMLKRTASPGISDSTGAELDLYVTAFRGLLWLDTVSSMIYALRALDQSIRRHDSRYLSELLAAYGVVRSLLGHSDGSTSIEHARRIAAERSDLVGEGVISILEAFYLYSQSHLRRARERWDRARVVLSSQPACAGLVDTAEVAGFMVTQLLGEHDELDRRTQRCIERSTEHGNTHAVTAARVYSAVVALANDRLDDARAQLRQVNDEASPGWNFVQFSAFRFSVYCDLYDRRIDDALARLKRVWPSLIHSNFLAVRTARSALLGLRALCFAHALKAGRPVSLRQFKSDIRVLVRVDQAQATGQAYVLRASIASLRGRNVECETLLRRALSTYDSRDFRIGSAHVQFRLSEVVDGPERAKFRERSVAFLNRMGVLDVERWVDSQSPPMRSS